MLKKQRGTLFQATRRRGEQQRQKEAGRAIDPHPSIHPSLPPPEGAEEANGSGEAHAKGRRPASPGWAASHCRRVSPLIEGWTHGPLPLPPRKGWGRAFHAISPKQVQVMNTRRKMWARRKFPFSSLPAAERSKLEDTGEEGPGHLKAPIQLPR